MLWPAAKIKIANDDLARAGGEAAPQNQDTAVHRTVIRGSKVLSFFASYPNFMALEAALVCNSGVQFYLKQVFSI